MHLSDLAFDLATKLGGLEKEIASQFVIELQKNTPVDTGHLRSSWFFLPPVSGTTTIINTAPYADFVENGTDKQRAQKYTAYTIKYKTDVAIANAIDVVMSGTGSKSVLERLLGK